MTPIAPNLYQAVAGGRTTGDWPSSDTDVLPLHGPTPTCPVARPPPEF